MKTVRVSIPQGPVQSVQLQFFTLTATLIAAVLQAPDGKGINFIPSGQLTMGKHKALQPAVSACMEYQQMNLPLGMGSLLRPKLSTIQSKRHCSFILSCELETHKLSVTYVSFPVIVATSIVAVLQAPDGKDSG